MLGRSLPAQAFEMGRTVKNFLIGLVVLPVVVVAAMLVYWLGATTLAILGGLVAILVVAIPVVLKILCVVVVIGGAIWGLGRIVSSIVSHNTDGQ